MPFFIEVLLNGNAPVADNDLLRDRSSARQWRVLTAREPTAAGVTARQMCRVEGPALDYFALDAPGPDRIRGTGVPVIMRD